MITLFTSKTCKYCPEVKKYLEDNNKIFETKDVGVTENRDLLLYNGGRGVPSILTHAGTLITGKDDIINYLKTYEV